MNHCEGTPGLHTYHTWPGAPEDVPGSLVTPVALLQEGLLAKKSNSRRGSEMSSSLGTERGRLPGLS